MSFSSGQWALAVLAALLVGVSRAGISGLGILVTAVFTMIIPAKQASGVVLPLLIFADIWAVATYRGHAQWKYLWKLFPWVAMGVVLGWFAMGRVNDAQAKHLIGGIVVAMVSLHSVRRWQAARSGTAPEPKHDWWFAALIGVMAGFTTLVANAAGPLMAIYWLALRLPKMEFVGTGAVFFMLLNWFKAPFMAGLGLITWESLAFNLKLVPAVLLGAWAGKKLVARIDQKLFETIVLGLSLLAGLNMLR